MLAKRKKIDKDFLGKHCAVTKSEYTEETYRTLFKKKRCITELNAIDFKRIFQLKPSSTAV
jgi:hypothetical protein